MPSDHPNPAKSAAVAAARHARAETAAATRTAMNIGRKQMGSSVPQESSNAQWVTALVVIVLVIGTLAAVLAFGR